MQDKVSKKIVDSIISQLLQARKEKKFSHDKVAELSRLNRSTISLIEARKREPTLLTCVKIANALDCDLSRLLAKAEKENR
jgi:transcriptional regulator with XRE-family HTH domain